MKNLKDETWKDVVGYNGSYLISNMGRVKTLKRKGHPFKNIRINKEGYCIVQLSINGIRKTKKVHRLVAEAFIPNKENFRIVNHLDGTRNNNHIENLEWCTSSRNIKHAYETGLAISKKGSLSPNAKLRELEMLAIITMPKYGISQTVTAKAFNVTNSTISLIMKGKAGSKISSMSPTEKEMIAEKYWYL